MKTVRFNEDDSPTVRTGLLNELSKLVSWTLSNRATVAENLAAEWAEVTFTGPASSLSLLTKTKTEPMGVSLVYLRNTATNAAVALGDTFAWTFSGATGSGQIVTTSFSGLASGTYMARLLVILR